MFCNSSSNLCWKKKLIRMLKKLHRMFLKSRVERKMDSATFEALRRVVEYYYDDERQDWLCTSCTKADCVSASEPAPSSNRR